MGQRRDLHKIFQAITPNVYFQPPETIKMEYPCIVYELSGENVIYADDRPYHRMNHYEAILIDRNPDTKLTGPLGDLKFSKFDRFYTADNLNHYVYDIYY